MTERLRYTGEQTVSFLTGSVGSVDPGGEFDVPDELAPRFLRRPDVERTAPGGGGTGTSRDGTGNDAGGSGGRGDDGGSAGDAEGQDRGGDAPLTG